MRPRTAARYMLVPLLAAVSCQSTPDISGEIDTFAELFNISVGHLCDCPQELGHETGEECDSALGSVDAEERSCIAAAFEGSEDAAKDFLGCVNVEFEAYLACLEGNPGCVEGWNADCTDSYESAAACTGVSAQALADFDACVQP